MMFMMPMPPTTSEMAAMPASRKVKVRVVSWMVVRSVAWSRTLKSAGSPGRMRCSRRSTRSISASVAGIASALGDCTEMARTRSEPSARSCAVESGR